MSSLLPAIDRSWILTLLGSLEIDLAKDLLLLLYDQNPFLNLL
jgi:hypothetical protein